MLLFAHRGGRAHGEENELATFARSLRKGIRGLESDVRLTADGVAVLAHGPLVGVRPRRRRLDRLPAALLPAKVPTVAALYDLAGTDVDLSLDAKVPGTVGPLTELAEKRGDPQRLWFCGTFAEVTAGRATGSTLRFVHSTRARATGPLDRHAGRLAAAGIAALNLPLRDWSPQRVARVQAEGVRAFLWNAHTPGAVRRAVALGVDAIYGDDVDALLAETRRPAG